MAAPTCDDASTFLGKEDLAAPGALRSTAEELLQTLAALIEDRGERAASESARALALRRKRLSAFRARLKERRAELLRDGNQLRAERAQFEAERSRFNTELQAAVSVSGGKLPAAADRTEEDEEDSAAGRIPIVKIWESDGDRLNALFRGPVRREAEMAQSAPAAIGSSQPANAGKNLGKNAAIADSVADYMELLLGRMRSGRGEASAVVEANEGRSRSSRGEAQTRPASATDRQSGPEATFTTGEWRPDPGKARSRPSVHEIRAGVGSLREIANHSARRAVARHTSRKLRQSVAITLPLSVISFVLAGYLFLVGGTQATFYSQAFGTVMLGLIVLIEVAHSFWKMRPLKSAHVPAARSGAENRAEIAAIDEAAGLAPAIGETPQSEPPAGL